MLSLRAQRFVIFLFLIATLIVVAVLYNIVFSASALVPEPFVDGSGESVPVPQLPKTKKELLASILNLVRNEIIRLRTLNQTDVVVVTRIQNLTRIRDKLQQMYVDLMEGRLTDADIDFGPEEIAAFLPALGPTANLAKPLPNLFNGPLSTVATTLDALRDASIYWHMEVGVQNYNPAPTPLVSQPGTGSFVTTTNFGTGLDAVRGGNGTTDQANKSWPDRGQVGYDSRVAGTASEIGMPDYKQRLKTMCSAIKSGQMGDPVGDFGCLPPSADVSETFDYKGRYEMVCERLGYTWGSGYQQMLGCAIPGL